MYVVNRPRTYGTPSYKQLFRCLLHAFQGHKDAETPSLTEPGVLVMVKHQITIRAQRDRMGTGMSKVA
jgi:hypothetical protein